MTQLKLVARTELADTTKRQLQFADVSVPENYGQIVQLSGYFDTAYADSLEVGATYELTLTQMV